MILGIGTEGSAFLYAGLAGVSVLCAYYALVCFRKLIPHRLIAVGIEDVIFWVVASVYIFRRMYDTTYGSIRWFFMLGILCGAGTAYFVFRLCGKIYAKVKKSLEKYKKTR